MAKSLTVASVEKHRPDPARRREIPDGRMPGLYLIVQPSGAKSWALRYRYAGKARKLTIGPYPAWGLTEAREQAQQALHRVQRGADPAREKRIERRRGETKDDFASFAREFIAKHAKKRNRSWRETARLLGLVPSTEDENKLDAIKGGLVAKWGDRKLADIKRADVITLLEDIADRAPIVSNRTLAAIRKLFNWAISRDVLTVSPCAGVKPPSAEKSRDRVLSDDELKSAWKAAAAMPWPFGPIVQLLILTGQRREEVAGLRWSEIDRDKKLWTLPRSRVKTDTEHTVPLSDPVLEIIEELPRMKGVDYVFSTTGRGPVSGFGHAKDRLDEASKVKEWRLHDLRRTVASGMARLGISLPVIEKVLNHRSGSFAGIVGVYQRHRFEDEKRAALEAWARFVTDLVHDRAASNVVPLRAS